MSSSELDQTHLDLPEIGQRIRSMLIETGLDGTEFALSIGVPYSTMRAYMSGGRAPSPEFLAGIYRAYGFLPSWLLTGDEPMRSGGRTGHVTTLDEEFVVIPVIAVSASAGVGALNVLCDEPKSGGLCFSREWLSGRRLSPGHLCVIQVRGSSMVPVLADGDQVLVNRGDVEPRDGVVYVIRQGEHLLVKYCQILPGGLLRVLSANPTYAPYDVDLQENEDVAIIGRVVASMHEW